MTSNSDRNIVDWREVVIIMASVVLGGAIIITTVVLGGGFLKGGKETQEVGPKKVAEQFTKAILSGDQENATRLAHSEGPIADELSDIIRDDGNFTIRASKVRSRSGDTASVGIAVITDNYGDLPPLFQLELELRKEKEGWRVWSGS
jgi:hypothetical protein